MKTTRYTFLCVEVSRTGVYFFVPFDRGALTTACPVTGGVEFTQHSALFSRSDTVRTIPKQTAT